VRNTDPKRATRAAALLSLALLVAACGGGKATPVSLGKQVPAAGIESNPAKAKAIQSKGAAAVAAARRQAAADQKAARAQAQGVPAPKAPPAGKAKESDPTAPGAYTYHIKGTANDGTKDEKIDQDFTARFDKPYLAGHGAQRQKVTGGGCGFGGGGECSFVWSADQVALQYIIAQGFRCDFSPPLKVRTVPLTVGAKWSSEGVCQGISTKIEGEVLRTEKQTIGGRQIDTFVLHVVSNTQGGSGPQAFTKKSDSTEWFSPAYRITVKQDIKGEFSGGGSKGTSHTVGVLKKLTPS
jgi:hypothetical protein